MAAVETLPGGRFEVEETDERFVLRRRRRPPRLILIGCALVTLSFVVPLIAGEGGAFAALLPGLFLTIAIFVETNRIAGRGIYVRLLRELVVERDAAGGYRDGRGPLRLVVDGARLEGDVRDVIVRVTPGPQPAGNRRSARQVYVLLAGGRLLHVMGSILPEETVALQRALRRALGLPDEPPPPAIDAVSLGVVGVVALLMIAEICALVPLVIGVKERFGDGAVGGAVAAAGVLLVSGLFAGSIALFCGSPMRKWVGAVHASAG